MNYQAENGFSTIFDFLNEDLEALETVLITEREWIKITKNSKLPTVGFWVLCGHNTHNWVDRGTMDEKGNFDNSECQIYPTHWKQLPESP